jgi:hypothetical protein
MKTSEFFDDNDRYAPDQSDEDILYEMSMFRARVTGLPTNIELWVRSDPVNHGHNRYRIKILKDRAWAGIYTVGQDPKLVKDINQTLTSDEDRKIKQFVKEFSSVIIELIDCKLDTGEFEYEVLKARGAK